MTARISSNFINYVDFIDIATEALKVAPKKLFTKMMLMIINTLHSHYIEIEKQKLILEKNSVVNFDNLDEFYDTTLDAVEEIKLLKKHLDKLKDKNELFVKFYKQADDLHTSLVQYIYLVGQIEANDILQKNIKSK